MRKRYLILLLGCFWLSSCRATYSKEQIEDAIKKICRDEYGTIVDVVSSGKTVYGIVDTNSFILDLQDLTQENISRISNVMLAMSRAVLSSNGDFNFIVLNVRGFESTGKELTFIRYINDIRRFELGDISQNEFFDRMILRTVPVRALPPASPDAERYPDIAMQKFLADMISNRLPMFIKNSIKLREQWELAECTGIYSPRDIKIPFTDKIYFIPASKTTLQRYTEALLAHIPFRKYLAAWRYPRFQNGFFIFEVAMHPRAAVDGADPAARVSEDEQALMRTLSEEIKHILARYEYNGYGEIHLLNAATHSRFIAKR